MAISLRGKVLGAARRARHRYDLRRAATQSVTVAVLALVPATGLARVDLWGGGHRLLGAPATFPRALAGVVLGIALCYVVTFLSNVVAGRLFCGWGCPVGQVSRFGEAAAWAPAGRARLLAHATGALYATTVTVAMLAWWCDPRVLLRGTPPARATALAVVAASVSLAWLHGRYWRWEFCKRLCPIGLYYTFVSPASWFGIGFDGGTGTCIDCRACDNVCPVSLTPRDLARPLQDRGGLAPAGAPGRNHCLECGDCVRACEMVLSRRGMTPIPLRLGPHVAAAGAMTRRAT